MLFDVKRKDVIVSKVSRSHIRLVEVLALVWVLFCSVKFARSTRIE